MMDFDAIGVDPERQGGMPCFAGTRVPAISLFDHLSGHYSIAEFLEQFPTVTPAQTEAALRLGRAKIEEMASLVFAK